MKLANLAIVSALALGLAVAPASAQNAQNKPSPEETTAKLNREQADLARQQMTDNAASQQAHDDAVRQQTEFEAEKARLAQQHEEAMKNWQADVDACKAGDRTRCAPPPAE